MAIHSDDQRLELLFSSDLRIQLVVVGDVVAVHTARARFQDGRGIAVRDAEALQVRDQPARVFEAKPTVKLQPICGERPVAAGRASASRAELGQVGTR